MNVKGDYSLAIHRADTDSDKDLLDVTILEVEEYVEEHVGGWVHLFLDWIESIFRMCWPKKKDD